MESLANAIHAVQAVAAQIEVKEQAATTTAAAAASSGSDRPPPPPPGGPAAADAVADGAPVQQRSMRKRSLPPSAEGGGCGGSKGSSRNFAAKRPKTGYRGVQKKSTNCFQAKIQAGKEGLKALGSFATAEQAAAAYDDELVRLGEARTNFATAELASVAAAAAVAKSGAELDDKVRWKKKKGTGKDSNEKELVRMRTAQKKCPKCERMWGNSKRNCACGHAFVPKASLGSAGVYYSGVVPKYSGKMKTDGSGTREFSAWQARVWSAAEQKMKHLGSYQSQEHAAKRVDEELIVMGLPVVNFKSTKTAEDAASVSLIACEECTMEDEKPMYLCSSSEDCRLAGIHFECRNADGSAGARCDPVRGAVWTCRACTLPDSSAHQQLFGSGSTAQGAMLRLAAPDINDGGGGSAAAGGGGGGGGYRVGAQPGAKKSAAKQKIKQMYGLKNCDRVPDSLGGGALTKSRKGSKKQQQRLRVMQQKQLQKQRKQKQQQQRQQQDKFLDPLAQWSSSQGAASGPRLIDLALPSPPQTAAADIRWTEYIDQTGSKYYYNKESRETLWDPPSASMRVFCAHNGSANLVSEPAGGFSVIVAGDSDFAPSPGGAVPAGRVPQLLAGIDPRKAADKTPGAASALLSMSAPAESGGASAASRPEPDLLAQAQALMAGAAGSSSAAEPAAAPVPTRRAPEMPAAACAPEQDLLALAKFLMAPGGGGGAAASAAAGAAGARPARTKQSLLQGILDKGRLPPSQHNPSVQIHKKKGK